MPENIGGLNYEINISGDWKKDLTAFEAQVNALEKRASAAKSAASGGGGKKGKKSTLTVDEQQEQKSLESRLNKLNKFNAERASIARRAQIQAQKEARTQNKQTTQGADKARKADFDNLKADIQARAKLNDKAYKAFKARRDQEAKQLKATKEGLSGQRAGQELADAKALKATREGLAKQKANELATQAKIADRANNQLQATQRNAAASKELAIKKAQILQLTKATGISQRAAAEQVGVTSAQAKQLKLRMFDINHAARQFLFTFRRLVGILAIFTAARKIAQALAAAVKEMTRFNAELETAEIGIASIVASVGEVRDAQGELVTGAEAFAVALSASKGIVQDLKKEAIGSIATFEALVKSYQVAIGPGLAAGLDLDQIKLVSKRLAEGALSLGVPLNQLSEEIRSLLQGTATARNTRIAVLFGGAKEANEAIRNAKEQGNLFEVLTDRFGGIEQGARAAAFSLNVLKSNLQDTVQVLLAEGGIEQFNQVKEATLALSDALVSIDKDGGFVFTPEALGLVQEVAGTLASVTQSFRDMTETSSILATLRNLLGGVGDVLKTIAPIAFALFQGILDGVNTVLAPLRAMGAILREVAIFLRLPGANKSLAKIVKFVAQVTVGLFLWKKTLLFINALLGAKGLLKFLPAILGVVNQIAVSLKLFGIQLVTIKGLSVAWAVIMNNVAVSTALATGGLVLLVGVVTAIAVKMGAWDAITGSFNDKLSEADKTAIDLEHSISTAGDETAEGAKSAKEWKDEFKELERDLVKAKGLTGLTGQAKELGELLQDSISDLSKGTEQWRKQNDQIDKAIAKTKEEIRLLKERGAVVESTETRQTPSAFIGSRGSGRAQFETQTDINVRESGEAQARLNKLEIARKKNQKQIEEAMAKQLEILDLQVKIFNSQNPLELRRVQLAKDESESNLAVVEALTARANVSVRELAVLKAKQSLQEDSIRLARAERDISRATAERNVDLANERGASLDTVVGLNRELNQLNEEDVRLLKEEEATLSNITRELEDQRGLVEGGFGDALSVGLEEFSRELPSLGTQIAETITGALSDVAGVVADVFKDAIDPRTDADLATAFGEFFLNLAGQFVEAITSQLINNALIGFGVGADPAAAAQEIATNSNTVALDRNTSALMSPKAGAPAAGVPAAGAPAVDVPAGGGADAASGAGAKTGGILGGIANASPLLLAILLPIIIALITQAFKKGGKVKGYASGGTIASDLPRPSSIPASDTVPAWLTPGEFVIKRESVKKYGTGLLSAINNGVLNPKSFSATGLALGGVARGVQGFAVGGAVARQVGSASSGQESRTVVLPVLPTTENNMNQMITGGRRAFNGNVNKAPRVGDPNAATSW